MSWKKEKFELNQNTSGVTASDGQGTTYADIWDYELPLNHYIMLGPTDVFSCKLVGDDAVEMPAITKVRVVRRDVSEGQDYPILTKLMYQTVKAFTDRKSYKNLTVIGEVDLRPGEHIVVQVAGADVATTGDTDASASRFKIVTTRKRRGLD